MLKFVRRNTDPVKDIVVPIIDDLICKVVTSSATRPTNTKETKSVQRYNSTWEKKFSWLLYKDGRMYCTVCTAARKENTFAREGAGNYHGLNVFCCFKTKITDHWLNNIKWFLMLSLILTVIFGLLSSNRQLR
jgi:hypothetical protein